MKLRNKYVIGNHQMWYEIKMLPELIDSYIQMMEGIENSENVIFQFVWNKQEYLERLDQEKISWDEVQRLFDVQLKRLIFSGFNVQLETKDVNDEFYNIAAARRDLNYNYCNKVDYVLWAESDSWFGRDTLEIIEGLDQQVRSITPKFILSFSQRKLWGSDWIQNEHSMFRNVQYQDNEEWILNNEASDKSYMTIERMNEINQIPISEIQIESWSTPKFDGSCLVIASSLIASGCNIANSLLCSGEDTSLAEISKKIMGNEFVQYHCVNYLHVHNRRHPEKRNYILNEDNKRGFCDDRKGQWWKILEDSSKFNYNNLFTQKSFIKMDEVMEKIKLSKSLEK